jgi:lipid A disaccharide synthetase
MLQFIKELGNKLLEFIKDDPVRPEIPTDFRVSDGRMVAALVEDNKPDAMVCVSFHDFVPESVENLKQTTQVPTTVVFYSVWSYKPGAGRELLMQSMKSIKEQYPSVTRFVTLSPKTNMAKRFHLKNGAIVFRENLESVNYEYIQACSETPLKEC